MGHCYPSVSCRLQRWHVKPATTPLILYSPITWASTTTTHRTDPASSAPCSCLPCVIPGGKWEWLTQLSKDQNTKIQQFLLDYCYLAPVPQPKSMLSCRHPHAGTVEEATGMWTACQGKVGLFLLANNTSLCQLRTTIIEGHNNCKMEYLLRCVCLVS